ncbi:MULTISPECIES: lytic transglycosylase domain-containing protein [Acetobacter]|uniref:lytic transglycosylase domain-containing protein n=1 Tax=Acetobacter TaxID=434 RepID=UPI001E283ECA|nr:MULTISPECIES: lytic transglycosylase domain-containing protein [Acetobacter]
MPAPAWMACLIATASAYHIPQPVLTGIYHVEGGTVGTVAHNKNGTDDLGVMQINTSWIPVLSYATGLPSAEVKSRLINDGCFNVAMSGGIFDIYRHEAHGNIWKAVGYYHSHTTPLALGYQAQVLSAGVADMLSSIKSKKPTHSISPKG